MKPVLPLFNHAAVMQHQPLLPAVPAALLHLEIEQLYDCKRFAKGDFECYLVPAARMPNVLREISRLREQTFREVGEGTGMPADSDAYDLYYHHLFLWDRALRRVVGAYRVGMGAEVLKTRGRKGFYTHSLFAMDRKFTPVLEQSLELGRSFVRKAYQRQRLPLFMLWQGILSVMAEHPDYRYMLGPVSISDRYSALSKNLMVEFVHRHSFDREKAAWIRARNPYQVTSDSALEALLQETCAGDLRALDKVVARIESKACSIPVLLRKYLEQNARILGFNQDPLFSNALDGLMLLDVRNLPAETRNMLGWPSLAGGC